MTDELKGNQGQDRVICSKCGMVSIGLYPEINEFDCMHCGKKWRRPK